MTTSERRLSRRIAIVEDHRLQRERTEELVLSLDDVVIVSSTETLGGFLLWLRDAPRRERPHVLLLDLMVEREPSVDPVIVRRLAGAGLKIVVISALASPPLVREIVQSGVSGVVAKRDSGDDILAAISAALRNEEWVTAELARVIAADPGRPRLSIQEERAMVLYASGLTLDAVATSIGVKSATAREYLARVKSKYAEAGRPLRTKLDVSLAAIADGYLAQSELARRPPG